MPASVNCITVSFRPAIPRQVAPQQSLLPLHRHTNSTILNPLQHTEYPAESYNFGLKSPTRSHEEALFIDAPFWFRHLLVYDLGGVLLLPQTLIMSPGGGELCGT